MSLLGTIVQKGIGLGKTPDSPLRPPVAEQEQQLRRLLEKARRTAFGQAHDFSDILQSPDVARAFRRHVPLTEYDAFYQKWWQHSRHDQPDVTWPGIVPFYALSSGTSGAASKYIPVTTDMIQAMKKGSRRMFFDLSKYNLPPKQLTRQMLMVGSCTAPKPEGRHFTGDLSGIIGQNRPVWLERYYRPGRHITDLPHWHSRIEGIAHEAPRWDIGFAVGNPMWVQLIFERILEKHRLRHIHQIWPHFKVYVHGGIFFEPYRPAFERLLGEEVAYIDSYMASEGFFAYQNRPDSRDLHLLTDCGIFYEFVPFTPDNFDDEGNLKNTARALTIKDIRAGETYAIMLSTCAGAWRYLLGDTLAFTDVSRMEFRLNGRTKQFLSVCGEHLSVDNLNEAVRRSDLKLRAGVREFAVAGLREGSGWAHQWWVSLDNQSLAPDVFIRMVDEELKKLNDDYACERRYALHDVRAELVPNTAFHEWLHRKGKFNGQAKIPRVLKGATLADWQAFVASRRGSRAGQLAA